MIQANLDKDDREFLKEEFKQRILMYLLILIISSIVLFGIATIIKLVNPNSNPLWIYIISIVGYFGFLFYKLKPMITELNIGIKNITSGQITDKKENVKYLWSGNVGADMTSQPKMKESYFTIDNQDVYVDEKYYNEFNIGDIIEIHFSARNGRIMKITKDKKEKTAGNTRL